MMHRGITIHKIPVEGAAGLFFVVGVVAVALVALPEARWFLAFSIPTGVVMAVILRLTSRD